MSNMVDMTTTNSAATTTKAPTFGQRSAAAGSQVAERFNFSDEKRALAALAEMALEELARNPGFAVRVRNHYDDIAPMKASKSSGTRTKSTEQAPRLVPIKPLPDLPLDATRRIDPWFILEYYGSEQLETALRIQPPDNIREAVQVVAERLPGTLPKGRLSKEKGIAYILAHVRSL